MFLFEEIRGPTCVPVGDIYCHQIFLEVQVVITRILRVQLRKSNIIILKFSHQNQIYEKYERWSWRRYLQKTHKESGRGRYFYLREIFSGRELSNEPWRAFHWDTPRETLRKEPDRFGRDSGGPVEPLEPGHDLILRELGSLLAEEHVVRPEIAASVHVLGRQSVHGVVHHIQDERLLT